MIDQNYDEMGLNPRISLYLGKYQSTPCLKEASAKMWVCLPPMPPSILTMRTRRSANGETSLITNARFLVAYESAAFINHIACGKERVFIVTAKKKKKVTPREKFIIAIITSIIT